MSRMCLPAIEPGQRGALPHVGSATARPAGRWRCSRSATSTVTSTAASGDTRTARTATYLTLSRESPSGSRRICSSGRARLGQLESVRGKGLLARSDVDRNRARQVLWRCCVRRVEQLGQVDIGADAPGPLCEPLRPIRWDVAHVHVFGGNPAAGADRRRCCRTTGLRVGGK